MKKVRVNFLIPEHLYDFVKSQADYLGIPMSTMYLIIVNAYKDSNTALEALKNMEEVQKVVKKK